MLLAIDTATDWASIALYDSEGRRVLHEETWWARRRHTTTLAPRLDDAVRYAGLGPQDLRGAVVAIGPGSYTGLRVGLALAKGLVVALGIPLAGIPTLDVVAYPHRARPEPVCAIIQAGRTRVCWAMYEPDDAFGPVGGRDGYHLDDVPTVAAALAARGETVYVCGELTPSVVTTLRGVLGPRVRVGSPAEGLRRAGFLGELGWHRLRAGQADDPASLSPIYLRHPGSVAP